jgi:hypothetical protein
LIEARRVRSELHRAQFLSATTRGVPVRRSRASRRRFKLNSRAHDGAFRQIIPYSGDASRSFGSLEAVVGIGCSPFLVLVRSTRRLAGSTPSIPETFMP